MEDTLNQIPPEAWPLIEILLLASAVTATGWFIIAVFVWWRRKASNLTPVNAAKKNRHAQPDFLKVDEEARGEAVERGEEFDEELERRQRAEDRAAGLETISLSERVARFISLFMSLFSLATMIFGAIFQVSRMGSMMQEYSSSERLVAIIQSHPIAFTITSLVIVFHIYRFFAHRKWKEG